MQHIQWYISQWEARFAQHDFFSMLRRDTRLDRVLDFIPEAATFWIMLFQDIIKLNVSRIQDPQLKALVQRHAGEDYGHDNWYLDDLKVIFPGRQWDVAWLFSREGIVFREQALAISAELFRPLDDRLRLIYVEAIEGTSQVFFPRIVRHLAECGLDKGLKFFAPPHLKVEDNHTLFEDEVQQELNSIVLPQELRGEALGIVDRVFEAVMQMADTVVQQFFQQAQEEHSAPGGTSARRPVLPRPDTVARQSFRSFGETKLRALCEALELGDELVKTIQLFERMTASWGERAIGRVPRWPSEVADDHSPIEFSIAFGEPRPELRMLVEPQGHPASSLESIWEAGKELNARLQREFDISLERFTRIEDLFAPHDPSARFAMVHAAGVKPGKKVPYFKLYLNPNVRGPEQAPAVVREMMERLGMASAWSRLSESVLLREKMDALLYLSLDLSPHSNARVKVYINHRDATAEHFERVLACAPDYKQGQARDFCRKLLDTQGPFTSRPLLTAFSFVSGDDRPYGATLHVPVRDYLDNDSVVLERISHGLAPVDRQRLERAVLGMADRPLTQGVGLHAHASSRWQGGHRTVTVYLAIEAYAFRAARPSMAAGNPPRAFATS